MDAALVEIRRGRKERITGVDGRAAGQQRVCECRTTVVLQGTQQRVDRTGGGADQVTIHVGHANGSWGQAGVGVITDQTVADREWSGARKQVRSVCSVVPRHNRVFDRDGIVMTQDATPILR